MLMHASKENDQCSRIFELVIKRQGKWNKAITLRNSGNFHTYLNSMTLSNATEERIRYQKKVAQETKHNSMIKRFTT